MPDKLTVHLLGQVTIDIGGKRVTGLSTRKTEALLIFLACNRRPYAREVLADMLWDDRPQDQALANLRSILSGLRPVLGPYLRVDRQTAEFNRQSNYWLDTEAFEWQLSPMLTQLTSSTTRPDDATLLRLREVLRLYQGDFLTGYYLRESQGFEEWAGVERERLKRLAIAGLNCLVEYSLESGDYVEGIQFATRLVQLDSLNEEAHRQVMLMLARSGQANAALAQFNVCRQLLVDELGVAPSPPTMALYELISSSRTAKPHNLPAYPSPFVGRSPDLAEIQRRLADPACRLLTLVGVGGMGKTRLAVEAAFQIASHQPGRFLHGIRFASLLALESTGQLLATMAEAIGLALSGAEPPQVQLLNFLREKEMLLVLDNFEHLLDADGSSVTWLTDILKQAPRIRFLVTSRERLDLYEEWVFDVSGLSLPAGEPNPALEDFDATQLFLKNARRLQRNFLAKPLESDEALQESGAIVRVCQLLDGMPLGIELASAWVRQFTCREILANIESNLDFLATSLHNIPERHRSLRAVFEQTWQMLSEVEKEVCRKLAILRGPFRLEAAQAVAGGSQAALEALVNKSFLNQTRSTEFELHPLLQQFATEKLLAVAGDSQEVQARHAHYFAKFIHEREALLNGSQQAQVLTEIGATIADIRSAWHWAVASENGEALERLLVGLGTFYSLRQWLNEGLEMLALAAALPLMTRSGNELLAIRVAVRRADLYSWLGTYAEARALLQQSIQTSRELQFLPELALALNTLGRIDYWIGDYKEAHRNGEESLSLWRQIDNPLETANALTNLANTICDESADYERARPLYAESLAISRALDDRFGIAASLINLGAIAMEEEDYPTARPLFEESLTICREISYRNGEWAVLKNLGQIAARTGDKAAALNFVEESLRIKRQTGDRRAILSTLGNLGQLSCELGNFGQAKVFFEEAFQVAIEIKTPYLVYDVLTSVTHLLAKTNALELAVEVQAFVLNQSLGQEVRDRAQDRMTALQTQLTPAVVAQCRQRGRAKQLDGVIEGILNELREVKASSGDSG